MLLRLRIADKILLVIVLPLLYQALLLGFLWRGQEEHKNAQKWAMHSKDVLLQTGSVVEYLLSEQGALRAYALTRDEESVRRVHEDASRIGPKLHELFVATADNPSQQHRLQQLEQDVNARLRWQNTVL